jgi:5-methyltetrahydropteroyltriglutamate--homocysteine methyltransferase
MPTVPDHVELPTEPIGSIPRPPPALIEARRAYEAGTLPVAYLEALCEEAIRDTLARFEATGSPVITDGEQRQHHNFACYRVHGLPNFAPDGFKLQFVNHFRV